MRNALMIIVLMGLLLGAIMLLAHWVLGIPRLPWK